MLGPGQMVQHMQGAQAARLLQPRPGVLVPAVLDAAIGAVPRCCTAILKPKPHVLFHFPPARRLRLARRARFQNRLKPRGPCAAKPGQYISAPGPGKQEKRVVADARAGPGARETGGMSDTVDYIVVGAGSAGCVLANRLSEDGAHAVCLLEAGPRDRYPWIHIPIGYGKTMFHKEVNWGYYTDPDPNMLGRRICWPRAPHAGGSSAINGLIYIRGQRADYDAWAAAGNPGWRWEDCLPYFRRLEDNDLGESPTRGVGGR